MCYPAFLDFLFIRNISFIINAWPLSVLQKENKKEENKYISYILLSLARVVSQGVHNNFDGSVLEDA